MKVEVNGNTYINPTNLSWEDHKAITVNFVIQVLYNISIGLDPYKHLQLPVESLSFRREYWSTIEIEVRKFLYQHCCEKDKAILTYQAAFISHIVGASVTALSEIINDMENCELLNKVGDIHDYPSFAVVAYGPVCKFVDLTKQIWDEIHLAVENSTKVE